MERSLFTGVLSFDCPDGSRRRFGDVGAFGPVVGSGTVSIALSMTVVNVRCRGAVIAIELPEEWAKVLADRTTEAVLGLCQLRGLHKIGWLAPAATQHNPSFIDEEPALIRQAVSDVNTKEDFIRFVRKKASDLRFGDAQWENLDLQTFLDGLTNYTVEAMTPEDGAEQSKAEEPSWNLFARILEGATRYV